MKILEKLNYYSKNLFKLDIVDLKLKYIENEDISIYNFNKIINICKNYNNNVNNVIKYYDISNFFALMFKHYLKISSNDNEFIIEIRKLFDFTFRYIFNKKKINSPKYILNYLINDWGCQCNCNKRYSNDDENPKTKLFKNNENNENENKENINKENINSNFERKYLKYKLKYLKLKN